MAWLLLALARTRDNLCNNQRTSAVGQNNRRFHCPRNDAKRAAPQTPAGYHYCVDNRELFVIENHHPCPPRFSALVPLFPVSPRPAVSLVIVQFL